LRTVDMVPGVAPQVLKDAGYEGQLVNGRGFGCGTGGSAYMYRAEVGESDLGEYSRK